MNLTDITKQIRAFADQLEGQNKPAPPPFQLPPPPPGMQWHREDGWRAKDLPPGTRPLVMGEEEQFGDEYWSESGGRWGLTPDAGRAVSSSFRLRTSRPLVFTHEGKQWTYHFPGDPMPCDGERFIDCLMVGDWPFVGRVPFKASVLNWGERKDPRHAIVGWRYAEPATKEVELGPEDVPPGSVLRIKGSASKWFAPVSVLQDGLNFMVNTTSAQQFRSWYQLRKNHEINRSLPLTGKWNPEAWEPCHKIITTP